MLTMVFAPIEMTAQTSDAKDAMEELVDSSATDAQVVYSDTTGGATSSVYADSLALDDETVTSYTYHKSVSINSFKDLRQFLTSGGLATWVIILILLVTVFILLIPLLVFGLLLWLVLKALRRKKPSEAPKDEFAFENKNRNEQDNWDNMNNNKKLCRSNDRILGGVCAGFAEYFGIDVTLFRFLYACLTFFTAFSGVIVYIIALILIPERR